MKLIYIANRKIPTEKASGYQIVKMCEEFSRAGMEVELWVPNKKDSQKQDPFEFYELEKNFKIKEIEVFDFFRYYRYLGQYSFLLYSLFFLFKLSAKKLDKRAVVYTRSPEIAWLFSRKGYKIIFEMHRWPQTKTAFFKYFIKRAKIVVVTNHLKELCLKNDFKESNILVAPDGVDLKIFDLDISKNEARQKLNLPLDKKIFGYTGSFKTMREEKGVLDIFQAIKILLASYPEIFFLAVGGTKDEILSYQKLAKNLGIDKKILLLERVKRPVLALYQKACDILLMPFPYSEHFAYYMSPLKMFEYMVSGQPIIASDLPSVREILNNKNAILVKPDDAKNLAVGIKKLMEDNQLGEKIASVAYLDVQQYSWGKRAEKIINFIKE